MSTFRVDYNYYADLKYDTLLVEAEDLIAAENKAEGILFEDKDLINPMIDVIEEVKAIA